MIECVIFDVDGTLVDSVDLHAKAWQEALAEFGKTVSFEEVRAQIGKGGDQLLPVFLTSEERDRLEKDISSWRSERFQKHYLSRVVGFENVRALFQRILADGKKIALASSAQGEELEAYKDLAQIADLIDTETSKDDASKSKPHPDIFKAALERLGNPPAKEVIVVGDTPYDIEAAAKLGVKTIGVRCGGFPEATLADAIAIYNNPTDLLSHYGDSPLGTRWVS